MPPAEWSFLEKATLTPTLDMSMDGQDYHHGQEQRPGPALQRGHQSGPSIIIGYTSYIHIAFLSLVLE